MLSIIILLLLPCKSHSEIQLRVRAFSEPTMTPNETRESRVKVRLVLIDIFNSYPLTVFIDKCRLLYLLSLHYQHKGK